MCCNRLQLFFRHLIACGNDTARSISEFSTTSIGRRFVEINLVETTYDLHRVDTIFDRIRAVQQRTCSQVCRHCQSLTGFFCIANRFELNSMLRAFQNPHVRMVWNTYMHVECQNLIVYKAQYTSKREDTVFKTKYYSSYLYTNFV